MPTPELMTLSTRVAFLSAFVLPRTTGPLPLPLTPDKAVIVPWKSLFPVRVRFLLFVLAPPMIRLSVPLPPLLFEAESVIVPPKGAAPAELKLMVKVAAALPAEPLVIVPPLPARPVPPFRPPIVLLSPLTSSVPALRVTLPSTWPFVPLALVNLTVLALTTIRLLIAAKPLGAFKFKLPLLSRTAVLLACPPVADRWSPCPMRPPDS